MECYSLVGSFLGVMLVMCMGLAKCTSSPCSPAVIERPRPGISAHPWEEELAAKQLLDSAGSVRVGADVVLWYPVDSLSDQEAEAIVTRLDRGVQAAKRTIGQPDWQVEGDRRIHFYCLPGKGIAGAPGGNSAFIPLWRMRADRSPWLHEALHLLLAPRNGDWLALEDSVAMQRTPLWLMEGMAEALSMEIAAREKLTWFSAFMDGAPDRIDSLAVVALREAPSDPILAFIGIRGKLPQLYGPDRFRYAKPFYTASASFIRFIARRYGYAPLLHAMADFDHEQEILEREVGVPLAQLKQEWLTEIGYSLQPTP